MKRNNYKDNNNYNNEEYQKYKKVVDDFNPHRPYNINGFKDAKEKMNEIETATKVNNALSIMETLPVQKETVESFQKEFDKTEYGKDFRNYVKEAKLENGTFNKDDHEKNYLYLNYLNAGDSITKTDINGNTLNMKSNAYNTVTQVSRKREQGYNSTNITNGTGATEYVLNEQFGSTATYLTEAGFNAASNISGRVFGNKLNKVLNGK